MRAVVGSVGAMLLGMLVVRAQLPAAEEAWRADGRRMPGALTLEQGRLRFTPTAGEKVALNDIARIRFPKKPLMPFRVGGGRRVWLRDGQRITCQLLGIDKDKLTMRTAWSDRLELPRAAVASIDSLPGWRTVAEDDFRTGLQTFTTTGKPELTEAESEPRSVLLGTIGQSVAYVPKSPLEAGRVGVNFQERKEASGARWTFEVLFQEGERLRRVSVIVAGEGEHYAVDSGGLKGNARKVARTPGWHRLLVGFTKRSLRITCDEQVLWYTLDQGPGGKLKQVTWRCHKPSSGETAARGAMAWTEFCLERAVNEYPKPPVEAEQDEVRLVNDDQLFGRILHADRRVLQIEGRFGKRTLRWTAVAGCSFRRPATPPRPNTGANARVYLRSGLCPETDVLDGVVTALDERRLTLRHALLGEVILERNRVREVRPLPGAPK
jgi:hypothetical protein